MMAKDFIKPLNKKLQALLEKEDKESGVPAPKSVLGTADVKLGGAAPKNPASKVYPANGALGGAVPTNPVSKVYRAVSARVGAGLTEEQKYEAHLVGLLPSGFPIDGWEDLTTKQQLSLMQHSGLNPQEQWILLNATTRLSMLSQHNQAQKEIDTKEYATKIVTTLRNTIAQTAAAKAQATAAAKPSNSTPLQNNGLRQKLDMFKEEYTRKPIGTASAGVGATITSSDPAKSPNMENPIVDSRDAMERKKDKLWDKIESTYNPRDAMDRKKDEMWGLVNGSSLTESDNSDNALLSQIYSGASTAISKLRDAFKDKYLNLLKKDSDPKATWGTEMINDQSLYSKDIGTFGILGNTASNACGVIAIHNANQLLGFNTRFDDLSYMMQRSNLYSSIEYGLLGMNPVGLANLYERNGADVTIYPDPQKVSKDHDAYIAVFFYPFGGHYVAAEYNEATDRFEVYNLDTDHEMKELKTLSAQSFEGTFGWVVWGIDAPKEYDTGSSGNNNSEVE